MSDFSRKPWCADGHIIRCDKEIIAHAVSTHWSLAYANAQLIAEAPNLYALVCALAEELFRKIDGTPVEGNDVALKLISEGMLATARATGFTSFDSVDKHGV